MIRRGKDIKNVFFHDSKCVEFFLKGRKMDKQNQKKKNICEMKNYYYFCNVVMPYSAGM